MELQHTYRGYINFLEATNSNDRERILLFFPLACLSLAVKNEQLICILSEYFKGGGGGGGRGGHVPEMPHL